MRRAPVLVSASAVLLLSGCAATVSLTPAPDATSVGCARVVVGLPQTVGQAERRNTDAQGTAAWGTPASVTLTCGVETPEVSVLPCYTEQGVDWLFSTRGDDRLLTTYGRTPGVQVLTSQDTSANDALEALSAAVAAGTRATDRVCLPTPDDATPGTVVTPTPTPTPSATP